ncbi:hypothetical protein V6N11_035352 [Hibiscus sabdariffa]|uniref:Uncharacterized protein n=1 Tax=Hibiscus sabdariffa TaxID=183260 RepID=A0ABR2R049_9ROSI
MEQHSAIPSKLTQNSVPASLPSKESYPRGNCNSGRPQEQNLELGIGAGQLTSPPDPAQAENVDVAEEDMGPVKGVE